MTTNHQLYKVKHSLTRCSIECQEFTWSDGRKFLYLQFERGKSWSYAGKEVIERAQREVNRELGEVVDARLVKDAALLLAMETTQRSE